MSSINNYQPPTPANWHGRQDAPESSCFFQIIQMLDLHNMTKASHQPSFALLGFCCDEGIRRNLGRTGAKEGPELLRTVLGKLPLHRQEAKVFDAGNIICDDQDLEMAQQALADAVSLLITNGYIPILIGGGHEIAWGHYQGLAKQIGNSHLGIINFDTHFDMRPTLQENKGSSGTPFLQIATAHEAAKNRFDYNCIGIQEYGNTSELFKTAHKYNAHILLADDLQPHQNTQVSAFIKRVIHDNQYLYVSLCLDVFSAGYAPGVSAPQAFGLSPWQVVPLMRQLANSGKVISYDIAELSPKYDIDARTAKLAANFIYEIVHHHQNTR